MEKFIFLLILVAVVAFLAGVTWISKYFVREGKSRIVHVMMDQLLTLQSRIEKLLRWILPLW